MDTAWIGVVSALAGVMVGGIVESFRARAAFRRERSWALFDERRQHLEHIYEALEELQEAYGLVYADALLAIKRGRRSDIELRRVPWARLRMLTHLYAPQLIHRLDVVDRRGPALGQAAAYAVMLASGDPVENSRLVDSMSAALSDLSTAVEHLRRDIVAESRRIAKERSRLSGNHREAML